MLLFFWAEDSPQPTECSIPQAPFSSPSPNHGICSNSSKEKSASKTVQINNSELHQRLSPPDQIESILLQ